LPQQWKQSTSVPVYKKGNETDYSNSTGISLLPTTYKILPNVISRLTPRVNEIIGDHQCAFRRID